MICPKCKAEYREGFTRCADCDVELVQTVAEVSKGDAEGLAVYEPVERGPGSSDDPFCEFWKGEDPRVFAELRAILSEAEIPHREFERQDHLFNSIRFPESRLAIPFSMFEKAERAVEEAYGSAEEADSVMHPTEQNREEYRKLVAWTLEEKLEQVKDKKEKLGEETDERGRD